MVQTLNHIFLKTKKMHLNMFGLQALDMYNST